MKKIRLLVMALFLLSSQLTLCSLSVYANSASEEDFETMDVDNGVAIIGYNGIDKEIVIPSEINGKPVVAIGDYALSRKNLKSVNIPLGVTKIGNGAFENNQLTNIVLPSSVTTIGYSAFEGNQITNVELPSSLTTIGSFAFANNQLVSINIPSSVTTIGMSAFAKNQLTSIELPSSITTIENGVFAYNHLTRIELPSSVTTIGMRAFEGNQLTNVELPSNVTTIGSFAFINNQLVSINIPSSVTELGDYTFANNQLTSIELPASITTIENGAFAYNHLTRIELPSSVTKIGMSAFAHNQLTSIEIPSSVKEIDQAAFGNNKLEFVTFHGEPNFYWMNEGMSPFSDQYSEERNFNGWFKDKDYTIEWDYSILQPMTIYGQWDKEYYNVTFDSRGGSDVVGDRILKGELVPIPDTPVKKNYTFAGWYKDEELLEAWDFAEDVVTENTTLYAKWTKVEISEPSYIITFDSNGGSEVTPEEVKEGEMIKTPATPTKEGYTFAGWYKDKELSEAWDFKKDIVIKNITLYAKWKKNNNSEWGVGGSGGSSGSVPSYTITFDSNGGSEVPPVKVKEGELLQTQPTPTKEGYIFIGWYKDAAFTEAWDFSKDVVTEDLTLYARWMKEDNGCNNTFKDIENSWAREMIEEIAKQCIIKGYPDGNFLPNNMIQRQHLVLMIDRALQPTPIREAVSFTDVPKSHVNYEQITRLQRAGIVDGSNGEFRPNASITRAEMAKVMVMAFGLTSEGRSSFKDVAPSHWASEYISVLADNNIALGDENGNYRPNEYLTRAEFAALMYRVLS